MNAAYNGEFQRAPHKRRKKERGVAVCLAQEGEQEIICSSPVKEKEGGEKERCLRKNREGKKQLELA